ncbi:zinc transport system substrate-binding protein [Sporomusaceae bacterium BoRhaA]|uniref:metal ABC transporter substrate-binding protein n=1 Tax=Pelorhabdus rhamnosifermentans TaxID=2772457 RepID=UPI001C062274|nr:metal ABC transporter substrate-binding protein [Pelorhabdus rhamnosifermentans]MBU2700307.1 zinc transport system substrate-binding protein [Pelorhabdus rhamnosifermentans]
MVKKFFLSFLLFCMILSLSACGSSGNDSSTAQQQQAKLKVVVSFNAMKEFAQAIGKDKVDIQTIIPDGTEPHDFEPTANDLEGLSTAKIFIYNGFGMENSWLDKALQAVNNKNLIIVEASKGATPIANTDPEVIKDDGQYDPHLWVSLKGAEIEAKNIKDAFVTADPANKDYYEKNYTDFYNQLEQLYTEYDNKFKSVTNKSFVTGHAAFGYLSRDFELKQNSVEDVFADGEPSAKKLKELTDYCKENQIKTIFVEDMVSPKVSEALANEVGAKAEKIYTIESKEDNKDYIQSMRNNLEEIYTSLK